MRIAVNTRLLLHNKLDGIGWFTFETLKRITLSHPEHQFLFFFDRPPSSEFIFSENITPIVLKPQARHPYLWYVFFEFSIPFALKKYKADMFISPDGWIPLHTQTPTLNVIHDLNFEHYPEFIKPVVRRYYKRFFHRFAQKSNHIATVSEFTKNDIIQLYGINPDKINVVYNGANQLYRPIDRAKKDEIKKQYSKGEDYFIFVGTLHRRKNITNLLKSFDLFKQTTESEVKLMIVGEKKWWEVEMEMAYNEMQFRQDVIFVGRLEIEQLSKVVASAMAMVYTSIFEGFGIPIIEAFYAEIPVITSNTTSMPEIANGAAMLADPFSIEDIALSMKTLYENPDLRENLIQLGREQRTRFSWDLTAKKLWDTFSSMPEFTHINNLQTKK